MFKMWNHFKICLTKSLIYLDLSNFKENKAISTEFMFAEYNSLIEINLQNIK